ncbi:hypothetical protein [Halioglobus japonicus]|uniref:hypothetical protein n=1 Tax=Halioglobus japonicus TaxID=930805 RepID=UPI001473F15A|nr:hypothetical protein [Halioglobus japonicus]
MVKPYPMIAKPEQGLLVDIVKPAEFLSLFVDERNYLASEAGIISIKGYAVFRKDIIQRISLVDAEKGIVSSAEINLETDFMATRFPDEPGASKSGFLLTLQVEKIAEEGLGLVACAGDREFNIGTVRPFNAIPVGRTPYCSVVNFEGDGSIFMVCDSEDAIQGAITDQEGSTKNLCSNILKISSPKIRLYSILVQTWATTQYSTQNIMERRR